MLKNHGSSPCWGLFYTVKNQAEGIAGELPKANHGHPEAELVNPTGLLHTCLQKRKQFQSPRNGSPIFLSCRSQVCLYFWKKLNKSFAFQSHGQRACTFVIAGSICHLLKQLSRHTVDKIWWNYGSNQLLLVSVTKSGTFQPFLQQRQEI